MAEASRFAEELNELLATSSMSAEDIVAELNKHGFPLPLHTFSYWLQGYFLPRSDSAFHLVSVLEIITGITDNRLSDALLQDLSSTASFVPGDSVTPELFGSAVSENTHFFTTVDAATDWESVLIQKAIRDEAIVSADLKRVRYKSTVLARVPSVPNPTFIFQLLHEEGLSSDGEEYLYDLSGIELKKQEIFEENGLTVCASHFSLPDDVVPGDLHRLSYSWAEKSVTPLKNVGERVLLWTLDFYSSSVTFEGGIPEGVRYATFDSTRVIESTGNRTIEIPNDIPVIRDGNTLNISTKKFGSIIGHFEIPTPAE